MVLTTKIATEQKLASGRILGTHPRTAAAGGRRGSVSNVGQGRNIASKKGVFSVGEAGLRCQLRSLKHTKSCLMKKY